MLHELADAAGLASITEAEALLEELGIKLGLYRLEQKSAVVFLSTSITYI